MFNDSDVRARRRLVLRSVLTPVQHAADLFGLRAFGNIYSRIGNPTVVRLALESRDEKESYNTEEWEMDVKHAAAISFGGESQLNLHVDTHR